MVFLASAMRFTAHAALLGVLATAASVAFCQAEERRPPFITTPADVVERMLVLARTGPSDLVVDLGSGDGRIVIAAAQKFGARGLGIELEPSLVEKSRDNARRAQVGERASFVHGDVLVADISKATVVTVYLLPFLMDKLQARFLDELQPGTRIVSHAFAMTGWRPDRSETMRIARSHAGQGDESTVFMWIVPAQLRGRWRGGGWQLRIAQNYQDLDIDASRDGRPVSVARASLEGRDVAWEAEGTRFRGRMEDGRLIGELSAAGRSTPLVLVRER
jgi:protein-L-isoaspartate O-methyltransferase